MRIVDLISIIDQRKLIREGYPSISVRRLNLFEVILMAENDIDSFAVNVDDAIRVRLQELFCYAAMIQRQVFALRTVQFELYAGEFLGRVISVNLQYFQIRGSAFPFPFDSDIDSPGNNRFLSTNVNCVFILDMPVAHNHGLILDHNLR